MRFTFDFLTLWNKLRTKIRNTGLVSVWFKFLSSSFLIFDSLLVSVNWVYSQIWLDSASERGLDDWGFRFGLKRFLNESDVNFRNRILFFQSITREGLSRKQKSLILESLLNVPAGSIHFENVLDVDTIEMGGQIGSPISGSGFILFGYNVFIDLQLNAEQRSLLLSFVDSCNVGGNFPIFNELSPIVPIMEMGGFIDSFVVHSEFESVSNKFYVQY